MNWLPSFDVKAVKFENECKAVFERALYNAFVETFDDTPTEETAKIAYRFAKKAAPEMAKGVKDSLVKLIKSIAFNVPSVIAPVVTPFGSGQATVIITDSNVTCG